MENEPYPLDYTQLSPECLATELESANRQIFDLQDELMAAREKRIAILNEIKGRGNTHFSRATKCVHTVLHTEIDI